MYNTANPTPMVTSSRNNIGTTMAATSVDLPALDAEASSSMNGGKKLPFATAALVFR